MQVFVTVIRILNCSWRQIDPHFLHNILIFMSIPLVCWWSDESKDLTWKRGMSKIVSLKVMQQKMSFAFTFSILTTTSLQSDLRVKAGHWGNFPFTSFWARHFSEIQPTKELGVIFLLLLNGWECRAWSEGELRVAAFTDFWAILYVAFSGPESYTKTTPQVSGRFHLSSKSKKCPFHTATQSANRFWSWSCVQNHWTFIIHHWQK